MARKAKNNFGGKGFKAFDRADHVGPIKAPGSYPADRRYGSSVTRTVIEKYDLDSNWAKWRRGYEYYNQAAWLRFQVENFEGTLVDAQLDSELYQGAVADVDAIKVTYDGYKFATLKADNVRREQGINKQNFFASLWMRTYYRMLHWRIIFHCLC